MLAASAALALTASATWGQQKTIKIGAPLALSGALADSGKKQKLGFDLWLERINKAGVTILLVEQDVLTAFELASRGFVLELGRITLAGATQALAENPAVRAAYLGL